jgi:hypothetical protein
MNQQSSPMNELHQELFEQQLVSITKGLDYPRTPNIAGPVMKRLRASARPRVFSRRFAWSLTALLVLFASLMLIPPARAAILEFIKIGIVRIFRAEPTPVTPPQQEVLPFLIPMAATPTATAVPLIPMLERLAGEQSLESAQQLVGYPILLPSSPPDLGPPDRIFVQDAEGNMTILVWIDPQNPRQVVMSLHLIPPGSWAVEKMDPERIQETTVNDQRAIWAVGPYPVRFSNGNLDFVRLIDGHVLIWTDGGVTYRLETGMTMGEAVRVAESLQPVR